jgi:rhodanese-related sulfurtransferase
MVDLRILMLFAVAGCDSSSRTHVIGIATTEKKMSEHDVTPEQARKLLDAGAGYIYLDVRTPSEFEDGRPVGAINIPIAERDPATGQMEFNANFLHVMESKIPHDAKVIVGCKSGGRSARACDILRDEGYSNVVNMVGGFGGVAGPGGQIMEPGWATSGYPVEKGDAGERSYNSLSKTESRP